MKKAALLLTGCILLGCQDNVDVERTAGTQSVHWKKPALLNGLSPIGTVDGNKLLDVAIGLRLPNEKLRDEFVRDVYDSASPRYHHFLTPKEYVERFAPSEASYQAVIDFATRNQLQIVSTAANRQYVHVRGTVDAISRAFHVALRQYEHPTEHRVVYAPDREPSLDLDVPISSIVGLDNLFPIRRVKNPQAKDIQPPHAGGSGPNGAFTGKDFRNVYATGVSLNGAGQTLGILEMGGYQASDIVTYEQQSGFPNVPLQNVFLNGFTGSNLEFEATADIELALSMAPGLKQITIYGIPGTDDTSVLDALSEMTTPTHGEPLPYQISTSYYITYGPTLPPNPFYDHLQQLAAQGQAFFVASGDWGSYNETSGGGDFPPNDDPFVTSVGGTVLTTDASGYWSAETTWGSSGGGYSPWAGNPAFALPSWQAGMDYAAFGGSSTMRNMPDVSIIATNISLYFEGQWQGFAGTSAAAPLWAGFMALVNQGAANWPNGKSPIGSPNNLIYNIARGGLCVGGSGSGQPCFHDITTGSNVNSSNPSQYYAVPGYDLCTGWGTPNGQALIDSLASCNSTDNAFTISASPSSISTPAYQQVCVSWALSATNPSYSGRSIQVTATPSAGLASSPSSFTESAGTSGGYCVFVPNSAANTTQSITITSTNGCDTPVPITIPITVSQCVPNNNACSGKCGSVDNGCGVPVSCATCASGMTCYQNACCQPYTCEPGDCGYIGNGCGGSVYCGKCGVCKPGTCF